MQRFFTSSCPRDERCVAMSASRLVGIQHPPTATPSGRTLTEALESAEALRSAITIERARSAQRTEEKRLHKAPQRRTRGGSFLQHLDATGSKSEHITLYNMEDAAVSSHLFPGW